MTSAYSDILARIEAALEAARTVFARFTPGAIETEYKIGRDPAVSYTHLDTSPLCAFEDTDGG